MDTKAPIAPETADPVAFLLLTLPEATVSQVYDGEEMQLAHGQLSLECVSLPIPPEIGHQTANPFAPTGEETHDLWLVLKVGNFEHTLVPGNHLGVRAPPGGDGGPSYIIVSPEIPNAQVVLALEAPRSAAELDDLGNFESLLTQYGAINPEETGLTDIVAPVLIHPPTEDSIAAVDTNEKNKLPTSYNEQMLAPPVVQGGADLRNKIVLVDEKSGAVLGELDSTPGGTEADAAALAATDPSRPVVVDFGNLVDSYVAHNVTVTTVPQDELDDWMFKGADALSRSILAFGSWGSSAMLTGAEKFKKHTVPCPEPIKVGKKTTAGLNTAHAVSYKGANVSRKTVKTINGYVARLTGGKAPEIPMPPSSANTPSSYTPTSTTPHGKKGYTQMLKEGADKLKAAAGYSSSRPTTPGHSPLPTPTGTAPPPLPPRKGSPLSGDQPPAYTEEKGGAMNVEKPGYGANAQQPMSGAYGANTQQPMSGAYGANTQQPMAGAYGSNLEKPVASGYGAGPSSHPAGPAPLSIPQGGAPPLPKRKRPLLNRSVIAIDAVWSAAEAAANNLISAGTAAASSAVAHKYGTDAGRATAMAGSTVRNVVLVYVDVRGVGRRSLLKATAKGYVRARLRSGETVRIQPQTGAGQQPAVVDHQLVVGVPQVPEKKR